MSLRRRLAQAVPPIARRDAKIADLRAQLREVTDRDRHVQDELERRVRTVSNQSRHIRTQEEREKELRTQLEQVRREAGLHPAVIDEYLARPSFRRNLITLRRTGGHLRALDPDAHHPLRQLPKKLRTYRLAASHGIATPTVYGSWTRPEEIDFDSLPDAVVIKSDGGAASRGVLPLRRIADGRFRTVDGRHTFTPQEVVEHFASLEQEGKVVRPYFAEELLTQPGRDELPDDVKVYAFYGEVQQVLLRRVTEHGVRGVSSRRYLAADGSDLGAVVDGFEVDETIPVPASLPRIVEVASHLSLAAGLPFVRVDVYDTEAGIVLGEITRTPGGLQRIRADHDETMGRAWEQAAYRLDLDLLAGRPAGVLHGGFPAESLYPERHVSRSARPGAWAPTVVECGTWCPAPAGEPEA